MSHDILLIARAWNFAATRHTAQKRKGEAEEPYVNHLAEVAELVAYATDGKDANLMAAAVLHDAIEDTKTTHAELATMFNEDVANLVAEVSDDKMLSKQRRKELQIEKASTKSDRAKFLKLADKTSNLRAFAKSPPADWSVDRRRQYVEWARQVVDQMRGSNGWLEARFDEAASTANHVLGIS